MHKCWVRLASIAAAVIFSLSFVQAGVGRIPSFWQKYANILILPSHFILILLSALISPQLLFQLIYFAIMSLCVLRQALQWQRVYGIRHQCHFLKGPGETEQLGTVTDFFKCALQDLDVHHAFLVKPVIPRNMFQNTMAGSYGSQNHSLTMGRLDAYYHKKKREQELWECLWRSDEP